MRCTCQLEVNHTRYFRLVDEMLQCSRKNSDRSLRIAAGNVFPFEPRLLQSLARQEHDKNVQGIVHTSVVCSGRGEDQAIEWRRRCHYL